MKLGLALGGGGARGLAHIPMLQVLDDLGIRPHRIAGTSIGAIIGALYASGLSAKQIRAGVLDMVLADGASLRKALRKRDAFKWLKLIDLDLKRGGLIKGDRFIQFLFDTMRVGTFEELRIPLRVVATDFYTSQQVVLDSGNLLEAVKASMALPGIFTPVIRNNRVLIDGGGVNPVPHDLLNDCDFVVAIDVSGELRDDAPKTPHFFRAMLTTFDIMQSSIIAEKMARNRPDIYLRPKLVNIDILEFYKADAIFKQARPACRELKRALEHALAPA
ncbi:MAG: patatin-like phospholipase family protein [bacterium]